MKSSTIFKILIAVCLMAAPICITRTYFSFSSIWNYILGTAFLLYLVSKAKYISYNKRLLYLVVYSIIYILLKTLLFNWWNKDITLNMFSDMIQEIFSLFYLMIALLVLNIQNDTQKIWFQFLYYIACCVVFTAIVFNLITRAPFITMDLEGYSVSAFPLLGNINTDVSSSDMWCRPTWFFFEASYLGYFLGYNMVMGYIYWKQNRQIKRFLVYLLAFLLTQSYTGYACVLLGFILSYLTKKKIFNKVIAICCLPLFLSFYFGFDKTIITDNKYTQTASIGDRQDRIGMAYEELATYNTTELILGRGIDRLTDLGRGVANAYFKMLISNGVMLLVSFFIILYKIHKNSYYEFYFALFAFNSTEIALTPIVLLAFLVTSYFYANNKISYTKRKNILDKIMELAIVHK